MQDKKVVALIVLMILAVASLIYGVTASPKGRTKSAATVQAQATVTTPQQSEKGITATTRRARRSQFKAWKRNPFASGQTVSTTTGTTLTLNGIIWNNAKPKAMIGDVIVVKGDTIGANKVVDIQPDKVILNDGTKDFELTIAK